MKPHRLLAALLPFLVLTGCMTMDWDSSADLSMTDKDPWEYYTEVYLDYENGRLNIAEFDRNPSADGSAAMTGGATTGLAIFFKDVLVRTLSPEEVQNRGSDLHSILFSESLLDEPGELRMDVLPKWIVDQLSAEEQAVFEKARNGDAEAAQEFSTIARTRIQTPWGTGVQPIAKYWDSRSAL